MKRILSGLALLAALSTLAACGSGGSTSDDADGTTITVYAASSLTAVFQQLGQDFEAEHDGVTVEFSFGGSSDLVAQIQEGAPADVFASADEANMAKLTDADLQGADPRTFASNTLEIAVPPDNPAGIASFQDLAKPGLALVLCAPEVPCGAAVQTVADAVGVTLKPVSEEEKVTDVLAKVESGEADAGVVYVTDVEAAGDQVTGIDFPEASQAVNVYPIATVKDSDQADLAQQFVDLVLSDAGQKVLHDAGFAPAP
ncbi:MAG: molybdate ABC transporter substrate-binding protein [Nocardioidaceae bacterium]